MSDPLLVLIVADGSFEAKMTEELKSAGFSPEWRRVDNERDFLACLDSPLDLIVAESSLPGFDVIHALQILQERDLDVPFIIVGKRGRDEFVAEAMRLEAADFILDDNLAVFGQAARRALEEAQIKEKQRADQNSQRRQIEILLSLRDIKQLIVSERDPERLLSEACRILIRNRSFRMVWLGLTDPQNKRILPEACAGEGTDLLGQILSERGGGDLEFLSNAAKRHHPCILDDLSSETKPWRDATLAMGFKSAMAIPMIWEGNVFGSINAYADNTRAFDEAEADLFRELAEDLTFALHKIVEENERRQAEKDLHESEQEKAAILSGLKNVAVEYLDPHMRIIWLNNAVHDHLGLSEIETRGMHCFEAIQGGRSPCFGCTALKALQTGWSQEGELITPDGRTWISRSSPIKDTNGNLRGVVHVGVNISDRKRAKDTLRETNAKFARAQRIAHVGSWENYLPTGELRWSEEMYRIFGFPLDTPISLKEVTKVFPPEEHERFKKAVAATINEDASYKMDYKIVRLDESIRYIHDEGEVLRDEKNNPLWMVGTTHDITERKLVEEELQKAKEYAENLIKSSNTIIIGLNQKGEIQTFNQAAERITGYSREKLKNRNWFETIAPRDRYSEVWDVFNELLEEDLPKNFENSILTRSGEERYVVWQNFPVKEHGHVIGTISFGMDITERKRAEEALAESENRYRTVFENTGTAILIVEENTIISLANSEFERITGYSREEIEGKKSWMKFVVEEDLERMLYQHKLRRADQSSALRSYEFRLKDKGGCVRDILLHVDLIPKTKKSVASLSDITELKRVETLLKPSLAEKEILLKEIHHRVKNNLQIISTLLYLQSADFTDEGISKIFRDSQDRIKSIALIHENLYRSGNLSSVDFGEYVRQLTTHLSRSYGDLWEKITLKINLVDALLTIDKALPCGVIINELISNSLKHAFPDGKTGEICIGLSSEGDGFRLMVSDDGIGRAERDIGTSDALGLQLVETLVKQIDGRMRIDSLRGMKYEIYFKDRNEEAEK